MNGHMNVMMHGHMNVTMHGHMNVMMLGHMNVTMHGHMNVTMHGHMNVTMHGHMKANSVFPVGIFTGRTVSFMGCRNLIVMHVQVNLVLEKVQSDVQFVYRHKLK
jgi:hypothetical protein